MAKIDYKNRTLLLSQGYTNDGQKDDELYFDRFDKVIYYTDLNGGTFLADGTPYTPSQIPNDNQLIYASIANGVVGLKFLFPVLPSSIVPENWSVENGSITFADQIEDDTLLLFTYENSDTILITTNFENMVGDTTTTKGIASVPGIYKSFDSNEELCAYYGTNGQTIPDPDGNIYIDYTQGKSYLDDQGQVGIETLNVKWIYIITTSVPEDIEGTMYPAQYLYAEVDGQTGPNQDISNFCQPVVLSFSASSTAFETIEEACTYYNDNEGVIEWDTTIYKKDDNTWWINDEFEPTENATYIVNWFYDKYGTTRLLRVEGQIQEQNEVASTYCEPPPPPTYTQFDAFFDAGVPFENAIDICDVFGGTANGTLYYRDGDGVCFSDEGVTELGAGFIAFLDAGTWYVSELDAQSVQTGISTDLEDDCGYLPSCDAHGPFATSGEACTYLASNNPPVYDRVIYVDLTGDPVLFFEDPQGTVSLADGFYFWINPNDPEGGDPFNLLEYVDDVIVQNQESPTTWCD
jgi:hypothetical protein